jgi:putative PIN family toxin of toxin-antitoxin system
MSRVPRVVLETNLVLSALVFAHGRVAALRDAWKNSVFELLISTSTADELIRVLAYPKFKLDAAEQNELLADYLPWCRTVSIPDKSPRTPPCRDPFDIPFLQLAVVGKADFLATSDTDLLSIKAKTGLRIVTAEALLAALI